MQNSIHIEEGTIEKYNTTIKLSMPGSEELSRILKEYFEPELQNGTQTVETDGITWCLNIDKRKAELLIWAVKKAFDEWGIPYAYNNNVEPKQR